jgi:hypothetical protein
MWFVLDSAHGHTKGVIEALKSVKKNFKMQVVAGNIGTVLAPLPSLKLEPMVSKRALVLVLSAPPGSLPVRVFHR